ncbi:MAG: hypothetical protein KAI66_21175 [Lentisphaeria bacterium]|nr:hypothetical protein [Lentisphaeria bacterium]
MAARKIAKKTAKKTPRKVAKKKPAVKAAKKKGPGRPRVEIDIEHLRRLALIHCTQDEIAAILGVSTSALDRALANKKGEYWCAYKAGMSNGKKSLRRAQVAAAMKGNATMLVWLGKQLLGQRDMPDPLRIEVEAPRMRRVDLADGRHVFVPFGQSTHGLEDVGTE